MGPSPTERTHPQDPGRTQEALSCYGPLDPIRTMLRLKRKKKSKKHTHRRNPATQTAVDGPQTIRTVARFRSKTSRQRVQNGRTHSPDRPEVSQTLLNASSCVLHTPGGEDVLLPGLEGYLATLHNPDCICPYRSTAMQYSVNVYFFQFEWGASMPPLEHGRIGRKKRAAPRPHPPSGSCTNQKIEKRLHQIRNCDTQCTGSIRSGKWRLGTHR